MENGRLELQDFYELPYQICGENVENLRLQREWKGEICRFVLENKGNRAACVEEVILLGGSLAVREDMPFYGEGFSMLSQYGGTVGCPENIGSFTDRKHYRLPEKEGYITCYNLILLKVDEERIWCVGFSSCWRFGGQIRVRPGTMEAVLKLEGHLIRPGERLELEELFVTAESSEQECLKKLSTAITVNHPRLLVKELPTGWCSWYCYGPDVNREEILSNLSAAKAKKISLKYIQIDDGYQDKMGDWLTAGQGFAGDMRKLCAEIRDAGFEPAVWVAPFIAEASSRLLREHPDWFVQNDRGEPLSSAEVTYGGWRNGPWYMLDGSHPEAREYLKRVFRTIKKEWGCHYFKLDANVWGSFPFGRHYDPDATGVSAYRNGMEAILEAVGEDSFLLGCNAPMWPSLGLVHGMRVTNDCQRSWKAIRKQTRELFSRNWQHNTLWVNDPDCLLLQNSVIRLTGPDGESRNASTDVTEEEFGFFAAAIVASGSMVLSGDRLTDFDRAKLPVLKKAMCPPGEAAVFEDRSFRVGRTRLEKEEILFFFNWDEEEEMRHAEIAQDVAVYDYWTEKEEKGCVDSKGRLSVVLKPHSARVFRVISETGME